MKVKMKRNIVVLLIIICSFFISNIDIKNEITDEKIETNSKVDVVENASSKDTVIDTCGLEVHYIDVGQADSILLKQGDNTMLIDGGNNDDNLLVEDYLKKEDIKKLDYIIATHPHEDHIGGLDYIVDKFEVGKIYAPKVTTTTKTFRDFVQAVKNKNMKFTTPVPGEEFMLGEAKCKVLGPNSKEYEDLNDYSIVLKVTYKEKSFIFTGDAEKTSEKEICRKFGNELKADVLKLGHHGSSSSTTNEFLNLVDPSICVITAGKNNKYGHPHKETMDKINKRNIKVLRTDEDSHIIIKTDGEKININSK